LTNKSHCDDLGSLFSHSIAQAPVLALIVPGICPHPSHMPDVRPVPVAAPNPGRLQQCHRLLTYLGPSLWCALFQAVGAYPEPPFHASLSSQSLNSDEKYWEVKCGSRPPRSPGQHLAAHRPQAYVHVVKLSKATGQWPPQGSRIAHHILAHINSTPNPNPSPLRRRAHNSRKVGVGLPIHVVYLHTMESE
jgi:hypothetical protein